MRETLASARRESNASRQRLPPTAEPLFFIAIIRLGRETHPALQGVDCRTQLDLTSHARRNGFTSLERLAASSGLRLGGSSAVELLSEISCSDSHCAAPFRPLIAIAATLTSGRRRVGSLAEL